MVFTKHASSNCLAIKLLSSLKVKNKSKSPQRVTLSAVNLVIDLNFDS